MREKITVIPRKNYIKFFLIIIFTLVISITCFIAYEKYSEYRNSVPAIRGHALELEPKDLDDYLLENKDILLYIGMAPDENSREVENDLIDLIEERNIDVTFLNISKVENIDSFYKDFNNKYGNGHELFSYPAFMIISDGKVIDIVQKEYSILTVVNISHLLDINEVKGEKDA